MAVASKWFFPRQSAELMSTGDSVRQVARTEVVEVLADRLALAAALDPAHPVAFPPGKRLEILFIRVREPPFLLTTRVIECERGPSPRLFVTRDEKAIEVIERRRFFRLSVRVACSYQLLRPGTENLVDQQTSTVNLSSGGAFLQVKGKVLQNELLKLKLSIPVAATNVPGIPPQTVRVETTAMVRRVLKYDPLAQVSSVALTFTTLRMADEQHIQRFLFQTEGVRRK